MSLVSRRKHINRAQHAAAYETLSRSFERLEDRQMLTGNYIANDFSELPFGRSEVFYIDKGTFPDDFSEISILGVKIKREHLQYTMRLEVDDPSGAAWFLVTHSQDKGGSIGIAKVDPQYVGSGTSKHVITPAGGDRFVGRIVWWDRLDATHLSGGANHPGDAGQADGIVAIAGQDWDNAWGPLLVGDGSKVLFYDFSEPWNLAPEGPSPYLGSKSTQELGLGSSEISGTGIFHGPDGDYYLYAGGDDGTVLWRSSNPRSIASWEKSVVDVGNFGNLKDGSGAMEWSWSGSEQPHLYYVKADNDGSAIKYFEMQFDPAGLSRAPTATLTTWHDSSFGDKNWVSDNGSIYTSPTGQVALYGSFHSMDERKPTADGGSLEALEIRAWYGPTPFTITVNPGTDLQSSSVQVNGDDRHRITENEADPLSLRDSVEYGGKLNDAVYAYTGQLLGLDLGYNPKWATVANWGADSIVQKKYDDNAAWTEVHTTLQPRSAIVKSFDLERFQIASAKQLNAMAETVTTTLSVPYNETETTSHSWTSSQSVEVRRGIQYDFVGISGNANLSYNRPWGVETGERFTHTPDTSVEVVIPPFDAMEASFSLSKGEMKVEVTWELTLDGCVSADFNIPITLPDFGTSQFWCFDINGVMQAGNLPIPTITEEITIPFFTNSEVIVRYLNNTFAEARQIRPGESVPVDTINANSETGEPTHAGVDTDGSLWYTWTAEEDGSAQISTKDADFDTVLGVYTGDSVNNLSFVAANDDIQPGVITGSEVTFDAIAGTAYRIALAGKADATGKAQLTLAFTPDPIVIKTFFTEDFSQGRLPASFEQSNDGLAPSFGGSNVQFRGPSNGNQAFLRTVHDDYASVDFIAEVTATIASGPEDPAVAFFGLGVGEQGEFGRPSDEPAVFSETLPSNFFPQFAASDNVTGVGGDPSCGGDGTHRLRFQWNSTTQFATVSIDQDYAGGEFVADCSLPPIDGGDNGFNATNSRIFFGGNNDITFDDFSVVADEAKPIPGDSNHDGRFNSSDLVVVFVAGEYEDGIKGNSTFEEGDWNGDGDFTTSDLVFAFTAGTYQLTAIANHVACEPKIFVDLVSDDERVKRRFQWNELVDSAFEDELSLLPQNAM